MIVFDKCLFGRRVSIQPCSISVDAVWGRQYSGRCAVSDAVVGLLGVLVHPREGCCRAGHPHSFLPSAGIALSRDAELQWHRGAHCWNSARRGALKSLLAPRNVNSSQLGRQHRHAVVSLPPRTGFRRTQDCESLPAARLKSNCVMFPTKALLCSHMTAASINNHIISARGPAPAWQHKSLFGASLAFFYFIQLKIVRASQRHQAPFVTWPFYLLDVVESELQYFYM